MSGGQNPPPVELAPGIVLGGSALPVISGPCVVESEELVMEIAPRLKEMAQRVEVPLIFKASYDKANRSSWDSFRGLGMTRALEILRQVKEATGLPILTDVHEPGHCEKVAEVCDVLQIPAFLCRQTDLLIAAAETGRTINLKKGQFMAPHDTPQAVEKIRRVGNDRVFVTERGYTFGYNNLVVDMRSFAMLQREGIRVVFDITHSLQLPGGGRQTGGAREYAEVLARSAVAAGADGVFLEVHPRPEKALSDSTTQLPLERAEALLKSLVALRRALPEVT
jgi:2-dehydro-3-deoxyphosphooctonate aldolase (KDO 8-P synthase)